MRNNIPIIFYFICTPIFLNGQDLRREKPDSNDSEILTTYSWYANDKYHRAGIILKLFKNERYKYYEFFPLTTSDSSEGTYTIINNRLELNSDFQVEEVKLMIRYNDSTTNLTFSVDPYPRNLKKETCYTCVYWFNMDSIIYYPSEIQRGQLHPQIRWLKVGMYGNEFTSEWVPIADNANSFEVILQTTINFDDYRNKVMKHYAFQVKGKKLKRLTK